MTTEAPQPNAEYTKREMPGSNSDSNYYQFHPAPDQNGGNFQCGGDAGCIDNCATCITCGLSTLFVGCCAAIFSTRAKR
jgi:hypothetical protein